MLPPAETGTPDDDYYLSLMVRAAACGDVEAGRAAQRCREELQFAPVSFDDMYLLARVIYVEAGSDKLSREWRENVGAVVMNRVDSPEFPDTLRGVIYQDGQYSHVDTYEFRYGTCPGTECAETALRLLLGERPLPPDVVFQANFRQGGGVYAVYVCEYGTTYLCISQNSELYSK